MLDGLGEDDGFLMSLPAILAVAVAGADAVLGREDDFDGDGAADGRRDLLRAGETDFADTRAYSSSSHSSSFSISKTEPVAVPTCPFFSFVARELSSSSCKLIRNFSNFF